MRIDKDYKFNICLSREKYTSKEICLTQVGANKENKKEINNKYGFKGNSTIHYQLPREHTCEEVLVHLTNGGVVCNPISPEKMWMEKNGKYFRVEALAKDGTFTSVQKRLDHFAEASMLTIDIDQTEYPTMNDFVRATTLTPSFCHTTYNNQQQDELGLSKGAKFHLYYVVDEPIKSIYKYRFCVTLIMDRLQSDTGQREWDYTSLTAVQYMNGTCIANPSLKVEYDCSNRIYGSSDISSDSAIM